MDEISKYLQQQKLGLDENPLTFWKNNQKSLPMLTKLALKYLSIPCSSSESERIYSTSGDIITKKRNKLKFINVNIIKKKH